jgi:hypothetical protein
MLHKMAIQRHYVSSQTLTPPFPYFLFSYWMFWKLADRYKCTQPIGEIFPTHPFPFVVWMDSWLTMELTMR